MTIMTSAYYTLVYYGDEDDEDVDECDLTEPDPYDPPDDYQADASLADQAAANWFADRTREPN